jgi:hypothetical protein
MAWASLATKPRLHETSCGTKLGMPCATFAPSVSLPADCNAEIALANFHELLRTTTGRIRITND